MHLYSLVVFCAVVGVSLADRIEDLRQQYEQRLKAEGVDIKEALLGIGRIGRRLGSPAHPEDLSVRARYGLEQVLQLLANNPDLPADRVIGASVLAFKAIQVQDVSRINDLKSSLSELIARIEDLQRELRSNSQIFDEQKKRLINYIHPSPEQLSEERPLSELNNSLVLRSELIQEAASIPLIPNRLIHVLGLLPDLAKDGSNPAEEIARLVDIYLNVIELKSADKKEDVKKLVAVLASAEEAFNDNDKADKDGLKRLEDNLVSLQKDLPAEELKDQGYNPRVLQHIVKYVRSIRA